MKHSKAVYQRVAIEELAKEFFNARTASLGVGKVGASLWISDPQQGHYIDAKDAARFHNWAADIIRVRSLSIDPDLLASLLYRSAGGRL